MDKVRHFEIPVDDFERAKKFYTDVFDWKIQSVPDLNYYTISTVEIDDKMMPKEPGAINGGMMKRHKIKSPVITITVEDIDKAIEKVKSNGGKLVMEKMKVPDMGWSAYIQDTEENIIGLWQATGKM